MKKKLLIVCALFLGTSIHSQYITTSGTLPAGTQVYKAGNGAGTLHWLSSGGLLIQSATGDRGLLEIQDPTGTNRTIFQALSYGTYLDASNSGVGLPLFINPAGGFVGVGTTSPTAQLDVRGGFTHMAYNSSGSILPPSDGGGGLTVGWNRFGGGAAEVNFYNVFDNARIAFMFSGKTGASTVSDFMAISGNGNVSIGIIAPNNARLDVKHDGQAIYNRGIYSTALRTTGTANWNAGIEGRGGSIDACTSEAFGVIGRAYNASSSIGGYFTAHDNLGCVRSMSVGVYGSGSTFGGYFNGSIQLTKSLLTPGDIKLNANVKPMQNSLDKIKLLKPSTFTYRNDEYKDMSLPEGQQMGLIAQDLEEVFPQSVETTPAFNSTDANGESMVSIPEHKSVNYISLIPVLIAGIQEQQTLIEAQQAQLDEQKEMIAQLLQNSGQSLNTTGIPTASEGFQMGQNQPNPFNGQTVIPFTLPNNVSTAYMAIYDLSGKEITTLPINDRGASQLVFSAENLSPGMYIYSIVADGKVLDSKRMTVANK